MFDVTNPGTLEGAQTWKKDLDEKVILPSGSPVPSVLLANKVSLGGIYPDERVCYCESS